MKTIVIYHRADFDGIFCREIAKHFLPQAILIGWDYGDPVEDIKNGINLGDTVYMLDISIDGLMDIPGLIWIDHHKSAIEKFSPDIVGYRIDGVAACRLAWQWFTIVDGNTRHGDVGNSIRAAGALPMIQDYKTREVNEPWAVRLAGEYDIWDKRDPDAELFQMGLRSQEITPEKWGWMLDGDQGPDQAIPKRYNTVVISLLSDGKILQYAKREENESIIKAAGFTIEFEGLTFLACNHARYNSFLFTAGLKPEHDACFGFAWRDGQWAVSLYHAPGKESHDLSEIAKKHGGGGHKGACGFRVKQLPFLQ